MRFFSILFLIIPLTLTANAQETITISGMVMNKETRVAIPWASIGIEGQPIGTLSGDNGAFEFHFHSKYLNDTLVVSHLGFTHLRICVKDILQLTGKDFLLEEEPFQLSEVVIRTKELSAKEVMKSAFKRIKDNYASQPYSAEAFYRDYKKVNGQYVSLLEAATRIYDEGYSTKNKEIVTINEIRRSKRFINEYESFVSSWNLLQNLLGTNDVKYKSRSLNIQSNKYEIEGTILFDKKPVYVITAGSHRRFRLYVSQADFGILRIEYTGDFTEKKHPSNHTVNDSIQYKILTINGLIDFRSYKGKLYPNYINYNWTTENINTKKDSLLISTYFFQELMVNSIKTEDVKLPILSETMQDTTLEIQTKSYNEEFWENYNIVLQNPVEEKVLSDLSGNISKNPFESSVQYPTEKRKKSSPIVLEECKKLNSVDQKISCLLKHYHDLYNLPASQIAISFKGKILYSEAFGYADIERKVLASTSTPFRIASVSKTITSALTLKLVHDNKLNLDSPVDIYVPSFALKKWVVTPTHLLTNTSGIRDYKNYEDFYRTKQYNSMTEAIEIFKDDSLLFEPGTQFYYSSFGFNLLGAVIEGASHRDFLSLLNTDILSPLKMNSTFGNDNEELTKRQTNYYILNDGKRVTAPDDNLSYKWSSGGMTSTCEDLIKFGVGLLSNKILDMDVVEQLMKPKILSSGESSGYSFGWYVDTDFSGEVVIHHPGSAPSYSSHLLLYPSKDIVIAYLTNTGINTFFDKNFADKIVNIIIQDDQFMKTEKRE